VWKTTFYRIYGIYAPSKKQASRWFIWIIHEIYGRRKESLEWRFGKNQGDDRKRTEASINNFETRTSQISTQIANITQIGLSSNTLDNLDNKRCTESRSKIVLTLAISKSIKKKWDRKYEEFLKLMGKLQITLPFMEMLDRGKSLFLKPEFVMSSFADSYLQRKMTQKVSILFGSCP